MRIQKQQCLSVVRYGSAVLVIAVVLGLMPDQVVGRRSTHTVRAGEDLQAVIDRAQPGDEIRLQPGAVFTGSYVLRARAGDAAITIRTDTPDNRLPSAGQRITPHHASLLPTLSPVNNAPVFRTEPGARHWRLIGLKIQGTGTGDLITLGDVGSAQVSYAQVPEDIVLDRLLILGDPARGQKRGIALNSAATTIRNCYIADIKETGQETQAIAGWNGPGPFLIENNYLEASGISVLFGGTEPSIGGLVPSDITVRRNVMAKPLAWRNESWTVKNLFELKNARRVQIEGNLFENNWLDAQVGFAILFTVRSSGPRANWTTVEDVRFENNLVRHVAGGINILGYDTNAPSQQTRNIVIRNNLFYDVNSQNWGGNGWFLQVGEEAADILVENNTVVQTGNLVTVYGGTRAAPRTIRRFRFRNNIGWHNQFGLFGNGVGIGLPAMAVYLPDGEFTGNVLAGGSSDRYPSGNSFLSASEVMAQFVNPGAGNFRLRPDSMARRASTDGTSAGADVDAIYRAMGGMGLR
jgi:Right handed beta helix region